MAIDPAISLQVRPPTVHSPLDAIQRAVSVADMLAQTQERQQIAKQREAQAPIIAAENEAKLSALKDDAMLKHAYEASVKYDPDAGDITYDQPAAAQFFESNKAMHLLPKFVAGVDAQKNAHRDQAINEATDHVKQLELVATPAKAFLDLPDEKKKDAWPDLRTNLVAFDRSIGKQLPYDYDPDVINPKLQKIYNSYDQTKSVKQKLEEAKERQALAVTTPEGQAAELTRLNAAAAQANGTTPDKLDQETKDANYEKVYGTKIARKAPAKPILLNGEDAPADAVDIYGRPIPDSWRRPGARVMLDRSKGTDVYQLTTPEKQTAKQDEHERVEKAYAFSIGKKWEDLNDQEKIRADAWYAKQLPEKQTDYMRKIALAGSDPELFSLISGHMQPGQTKPLTTAERAQAIARVNTAVSREFPNAATTKEAQAYKQSLIQDLADHGVNLSAAPAPTKPATKPAFKPGDPLYKAGKFVGYYGGMKDGKVIALPTKPKQ